MSYVEPRHKFETVRGVQQFGVRRANERAVLTLVAINPGISSAELARRSGLGPQTVSRILADLERTGFVRRAEVRRGMRGQPATPYSLEPRAAFAIGCEIGWRHCTIELVDLRGNPVAQHRWDYEFADAHTVFAEIASIVRQMTGSMTEVERSKLIGIGVASPSGMARNIDLLGASAADADAWRGIDVGKHVESATGLPVMLFNDGNAACWGELGTLPVPRPANFAYFLIGTFVGAGIVAESSLWEGPTGNSANLGSMIVTDRNGHQNFVHLIASIMALETRLFAAGVPIPKGNPANWDWAALEPHASGWIDDAGRAVAKAIVNTAAVIEFDLAIVDGVMPRPLVERLVESIRHHGQELPALTADRPTIAIGHLGAEAPARGAAMLPLYRRFFARDWEHFTK